jgi:putative ABC transport system permease protein
MNLMESVRIALRALRTNRLRSALTMLGIIIGVSAVILLVAVGDGVRFAVNASVEPLANLITVVQVTGNVPGGTTPKDLIDADVVALRKRDQAPNIASATPVVTGKTMAETDTAKSRTSVNGSTALWFKVHNRKLQAGSFFDEAQMNSAARVVVLGPSVVERLFGGDPAIALNKTIRLNQQSFKVIGVMKSVGDPDDNIAIMPLKSARRYLFGGGHKVNEILVQATGAASVPIAEEQVTRILNERHRIQNPNRRDFEVQSLQSLLNTWNDTLRILSLFTAAVAAISLVVGAIGVLNIMLVSVTERTREIGIRKAIGATRRAILQQFLTESIVLAGLGGVIGVLIGVGLSLVGALLAPSLGSAFATFAPIVSIPAVVLSFAVSLVIGLIAGGYPANRAARLRPIEALRYQ